MVGQISLGGVGVGRAGGRVAKVDDGSGWSR